MMNRLTCFITLFCITTCLYPDTRITSSGESHTPPMAISTGSESITKPAAPVAAESSPLHQKSGTTDRFENYNRNAYRMNAKIDKTVIRPTAVGYVTYVPLPIRTALANFFNNLRDFVTLGNDILQLNGQSTMNNIMRVSINSTFGLVGLIDVSSSLGLVENKNSFGNTMKVYGWSNSSYYVIPLLGPSTVRDAIGIIPDVVFNPTWYLIGSDYISIGLFALNSIDTRTKFLGFDQVLETSIDPYVTMRDTYLAAINEQVPLSEGDESAPNIDSLLDDNTAESGAAKK